MKLSDIYMDPAEFKDVTRFKFLGKVTIEGLGSAAGAMIVDHYEELATGYLFQVSEFTRQWRRSVEGRGRQHTYSGWHPLRSR